MVLEQALTGEWLPGRDMDGDCDCSDDILDNTAGDSQSDGGGSVCPPPGTIPIITINLFVYKVS